MVLLGFVCTPCNKVGCVLFKEQQRKRGKRQEKQWTRNSEDKVNLMYGAEGVERSLSHESVFCISRMFFFFIEHESALGGLFHKGNLFFVNPFPGNKLMSLTLNSWKWWCL